MRAPGIFRELLLSAVLLSSGLSSNAFASGEGNACPDDVVRAVLRGAANGPRDPGRRIDAGYVLCKWSFLSLPSFAAPQRPEYLAALNWRWTTPAALRELEGKFHHADLRITLTVLQSSRAEPHLILFGAFSRREEIVGNAYATYFLSPTGSMMELSSVTVSNLGDGYRGVAASVVDFFYDEVAASMGITRLSAIGDYLGRYIWGKMDRFTLADADPDQTLWQFTDVNGDTLSPWAQAIRNFGRFLGLHNIPVERLRFTREGQEQPLTRLSELTTLQELASVRDAAGRKIEVAPMLGIDASDRGFHGPARAFDVGAAFMAADYTDFTGRAVLTHWGARVSPYAMPPYRFRSK